MRPHPTAQIQMNAGESPGIKLILEVLELRKNVGMKVLQQTELAAIETEKVCF